MTDNDFIPFCEVWTATHDVMPFGKVFNQKHMTMIFEDLENYPLDIIKQAIKRHRQTAKAAPTVNDIIELVNSLKPRHIGVEEAWAKALPMLGNDNDSFIVTKEIIEAMALAESLWESGDKFSAARAFKEKYIQLTKCDSSPVYYVSLGSNKDGRALVVNEALRLNLIAKDNADTLLLGCDTKPVEKPANFDLRVAELKRSLNKVSLVKTAHKQSAQRQQRLRKAANKAIAVLREGGDL